MVSCSGLVSMLATARAPAGTGDGVAPPAVPLAAGAPAQAASSEPASSVAAPRPNRRRVTPPAPAPAGDSPSRNPTTARLLSRPPRSHRTPGAPHPPPGRGTSRDRIALPLRVAGRRRAPPETPLSTAGAAAPLASAAEVRRSE